VPVKGNLLTWGGPSKKKGGGPDDTNCFGSKENAFITDVEKVLQLRIRGICHKTTRSSSKRGPTGISTGKNLEQGAVNGGRTQAVFLKKGKPLGRFGKDKRELGRNVRSDGSKR